MREESSDQPGTIGQRLRKLFPVIVTLLLIGFWGAYAPILSPLVYSHLAPSGWHNITPHGDSLIWSYAASADDPGLLMACGQGSNGDKLQYWLSHNGGATWRTLSAPFGSGQGCELAMPVGEPGTIFVTVDSSSDGIYSTDNVASVWVSHDAGATWRRVKSVGLDSGAGSQIYGPNAYFRHGVLYDYGQPDGSSNWPLTYSLDDGRSWMPISSTPSKLERQGWAFDYYSSGPVPDYRGDTWWFRAVSLDGKPPELEHSTDNGRTWSEVGAIGTAPFQSVTLAVTPTDPGAVCAAENPEESGELRVLSSPNGGTTWYQGKTPSSLGHTNGAGASLVIGAHGDCYVDYDYVIHSFSLIPGLSYQENHTVLRLPPKSTDMRVFWKGNQSYTLGSLFIYIPAGGGMSSRLVSQAATNMFGLALLSRYAGEASDGQLAWIAAP